MVFSAPHSSVVFVAMTHMLLTNVVPDPQTLFEPLATHVLLTNVVPDPQTLSRTVTLSGTVTHID